MFHITHSGYFSRLRETAMFLAIFLVFGGCLMCRPAQAIPTGEIMPELLPIAYSGGETLRFAVSYTGGLPLGTLTLTITALPEAGHFELRAVISTDGGVLARIYPIHDLHVTTVAGPARLPSRYEVWQVEGKDYRAHRLTIYDQETGLVTVGKNQDPPKEFPVGAPMHNEFSAFFASRLMPQRPGEEFLVPTFADEKKNQVVVRVLGAERLKKTIAGDALTNKVTPILKFHGLYDKRGDTVIWYTADECRLPVKINSKIVIGSLTARLIAYENPRCPRYNGKKEHQD
jgi:hypothetical protein